MQSASASPSSSTAMPSSFQGLQETARACFHTTTQIVKEQAELARQSAQERVKIARGGKALLDEGGELTAQVVVAKQTAIDASDLDESIKTRVHVAIFKLDEAVAKLKAAQSTQQTEEEPSNDNSFFQLEVEHQARATACKQIAELLSTSTSSAEMSPEECDALAIVKAKEGCTTMLSKTSDGLESLKQMALGGLQPSGLEESSDMIQHSTAVPTDTNQRPTLLQGLRHKAHSGLDQVKLAANNRFETAKAGKRLLDDGGENVVQVVVAKKACRDAADIDRDIAQRVQCAVTLFADSAAKLREANIAQEAKGMTVNGDLVKLAEEHEVRADTYREIAGMLDTPTSSVDMNLAEWDALALVKVRASCGTLQSRTNEGFEVVKGMMFTGCASGVDRMDQRRRTVCA